MPSQQIPDTELILNADGSVYHLALLPEDLGDLIILVGDPDRVEKVSRKLDRIELRKQKREFVTHTGFLGKQRISIISTGIGTDNIDIVLNELRVLRQADLKTRTWKQDYPGLELIRLGTSGSVDGREPGSILLSKTAIGIDGLAWHYSNSNELLASEFMKKINWSSRLAKPYVVEASPRLLNEFQSLGASGVTFTANGFYHPQGRQLKIENPAHYSTRDLKKAGIHNIEMETAGIYLLASIFGFEALSINLLLADRDQHRFAEEPELLMEHSIDKVIQVLRERSTRQ